MLLNIEALGFNIYFIISQFQGDGGGPLICQMKGETDRYTQVGIVAWGIGCNTDTPGVYVDVRKYKKWILDNSHGNIIDTRIRKKN